MKKTVKVDLSIDKSMGHGHLLHCCDKYQQVYVDELEVGQYWQCLYCEKPLLLHTDVGFYLIGVNVTI